MSSLNITNPNNFTFDEKYAATHALYNENDNSQQEVNDKVINSGNLDQNQEEASNIQMDVNQNQKVASNIQMDVNQNQENIQMDVKQKQQEEASNIQMDVKQKQQEEASNIQMDVNQNQENIQMDVEQKQQEVNNIKMGVKQKQQEVNSIQMDVNQNQEEANNIQMDVNQKQQEDKNLINNLLDLYAANLNSNESQNNNLTSRLNRILQIEIMRLSQSGQPSNPSAGLKSNEKNLVPQSKDNNLVLHSKENDSNHKSNGSKDNNLPQSKENDSNHKSNESKDNKLAQSKGNESNHKSSEKNLVPQSNENNNLLNESISSIPISLETKLSSLIESLNMTNQMNQMMAAMYLISNNNTNRILDQLGKQIENQSKIIGILLEDRKEKNHSSDGK